MHKYIHGYMYSYMHTHIFLKHLGVIAHMIFL